MKCLDARKKISALIDGETGEAERRELLLHMEQCASCRIEHEELSALRSAAVPPARLAPPASLIFKIRAKIGKRQEERVPFWKRLPVLNPLAVAMALAMMFLIGNYLGSHVWKNLLTRQSDRTAMASLSGYEVTDESVSTAYQDIYQG